MIKAFVTFWMFTMAAIVFLGLLVCAAIVYASVKLGILSADAIREARERRKNADRPDPPSACRTDVISAYGREGTIF